jgi:hypothetical protein
VVRTPGENSENCIDLRDRSAVVLLAHYWLPGRGVGLIKLAVPSGAIGLKEGNYGRSKTVERR